MLKYFEFIKENNNESILEMILESDVIYSDLFKKTISKINSPLAKALLDIENKDLDVRSNYFDINQEKNDIITFIPDKKAQEILKDERKFVTYTGTGGWLTFNKNEYGEYKNQEAFNMLGFTPPEELIRPDSGEIGEDIKTISFNNKTYKLIKFKDKELIINVDKLRTVSNTEMQDNLWKKSRTEIKIGRAIRPLLKLANVDFLDKDIEEFVNLYKSTIDRLNDKFSLFEEVKEDEIKKWYSYTNYFSQNGTLGSSCMRRVRSSFFDIYSKNPEKCSLIILFSDDSKEKIMGRALLWTLPSGKRFMDRIYVNTDSHVNLFREYAIDNGWYYKFYNNSSEDNRVYGPDGDTHRIDLTIYIKTIEYDYYPYMDTLKFYDEHNGRLSYDDSGNNFRLEETDGSHGENCGECGGSGNVECSSCEGDGNVECYRCEGYGSKKCDECDAEGSNKCGECEGEGSIKDDEGNSIKCENCEGEGDIECEKCEGEGDIECSYCDGNGNRECGDCDGNGTHSCNECW